MVNTKQQRRLTAIKYSALDRVLASIQVPLDSLERAWDPATGTNRERVQVARVRRWLNECWDQTKAVSRRVLIGSVYQKQFSRSFSEVEKIVKEQFPPHFSAMDFARYFHAFHLLLCDAVQFCVEEQNKRPWNYLISTLYTFILLLIEELPQEQQDAILSESLDIGLAVWPHLLGDMETELKRAA